MKKITAFILIFLLLFANTAFGAKIDGEEIKSTILNGTTMVPIEDVAKLLDLDFMPTSDQYTISEKNDEPRMLNFVHTEPGKVYAQLYTKTSDGNLKMVDEQAMELPQSVVRIDGKLYVPFRFVCEYYNANVYWDEKEGARAYRTNYGEITLIKTDGHVRERVLIEGGFESGTVSGRYFVYVKDGSLYRMNLETGEKILLGESGYVNIYGNTVYVLGQGKLTLYDLESGEGKIVCEGVTIVAYTADKGAWCETVNGTFVYNSEGALVAEITGEFYNPWEYQEGFVYYLTNNMEMRRARADGSEDEKIIKTAFYPVWIDNFIYYTDIAGNYRRFDVGTKEDIGVYGLGLDFAIKLNGMHIMNYYAESGLCMMFISEADGTGFRQFGKMGIATTGKVDLYKDGIAGRGADDDAPYYITGNDAVKLTDDHINEFYGAYKDFVYYSVY